MDSKECSSPCWYVVHTNPRQEDRAASNLKAWNVETFCPHIVEIHHSQYTGQPIEVVKPLFSRYLFARFELEKLFHKIRFTRGVTGLVDFGDGPVAVEDELIATISRRMDERGYVTLDDEFTVGDEVLINDGAFRSLTGIFQKRLKGSDRVVILLDALRFPMRLELDRSLVRKVVEAL